MSLVLSCLGGTVVYLFLGHQGCAEGAVSCQNEGVILIFQVQYLYYRQLRVRYF